MVLMAGWVVAILAVGVAVWLWRQLVTERAHAGELLYAKLDLENDMDLLRADSSQDVAAAAVAAGQSVGEIARHLHEPLASIRGNVESTQVDLDDYRERVRQFDAAVQYCLQPVELILGADKASLAELVSHVEGARRKLFETRAALEKNPLHKQADALATGLGELRTMAAYTSSLLTAHPPEPVGPASATASAAAAAAALPVGAH